MNVSGKFGATSSTFAKCGAYRKPTPICNSINIKIQLALLPQSVNENMLTDISPSQMNCNNLRVLVVDKRFDFINNQPQYPKISM